MKKNGKIEKLIWKRKDPDGDSFSKIEKIKKIRGRKGNFDFEELLFFTWMCNGIQTFTEYAQIFGKKNDVITKKLKVSIFRLFPLNVFVSNNLSSWNLKACVYTHK